MTYDDLSILDWGTESGQISFRGDGRMILDNGVRTNFTLSGTQGYINIFEDSDHNGIYDYFELGKNFSVDTDAQMAISYNSIYDAYGNYVGRGSVGFDIDVIYSRSSGSRNIYLDQDMRVTSSTLEGISPGFSERLQFTVTPITASGTVSYDSEGTFVLNLEFNGTNDGASANLNGNWLQNTDGSITFSEFALPSLGDPSRSSSNSVLAQEEVRTEITLTKLDSNTYHGQAEVEGINYYITVSDSNDSDDDGTPDIGDKDFRSINTSGSADIFSPNGWAYWQSYPWIFNQGTWYYMKPIGSQNYLYNYTTREWKVMGQ